MRIIFSLYLCVLLVGNLFSQTISGKYNTKNWSHNNRYHFEELILKEDNSFEYRYKMKFIQINLTGQWNVEGNQLILTSSNAKDGKLYTVESFETNVPEGYMRFDIRDFSKENINYSIKANNGDTTVMLRNRFGITDIPLHDVQSFQIIGSTYSYPETEIDAENFNKVEVFVNQKRILDEERWVILDEKRIRPIGLDNKPALYFLSRQE